MAKKQHSKLAALIKEWEKAQHYMLKALVIRTAVYLSRIQDVPKGVHSCLDILARGDSRYLATQVDEVLRFLRQIQSLERMSVCSREEDRVATEQPS